MKNEKAVIGSKRKMKIHRQLEKISAAIYEEEKSFAGTSQERTEEEQRNSLTTKRQKYGTTNGFWKQTKNIEKVEINLTDTWINF